MLSCFHLVFSQNQIYILEEDGDVCSILQGSFGTDGEKSFCKVYKPDKNGMKKAENLILKEQDCQHNQWPLPRIIDADDDAERNDNVYSVTSCYRFK